MAYWKNGYVYHTEFDDASQITKGSIQRAGYFVICNLVYKIYQGCHRLRITKDSLVFIKKTHASLSLPENIRLFFLRTWRIPTLFYLNFKTKCIKNIVKHATKILTLTNHTLK